MSKCKNCGRTFLTGDYIIYNALGCYCADQRNCFNRRKNHMPNIKITAEVDGKIVPLQTISTESFEAIKAAARTEEIPVARLAVCSHVPRLLFKPTYNMELKVGMVYALDLRKGTLACSWTPSQDENIVNSQYKEINPL